MLIVSGRVRTHASVSVVKVESPSLPLGHSGLRVISLHFSNSFPVSIITIKSEKVKCPEEIRSPYLGICSRVL